MKNTTHTKTKETKEIKETKKSVVKKTVSKRTPIVEDTSFLDAWGQTN